MVLIKRNLHVLSDDNDHTSCTLVRAVVIAIRKIVRTSLLPYHWCKWVNKRLVLFCVKSYPARNLFYFLSLFLSLNRKGVAEFPAVSSTSHKQAAAAEQLCSTRYHFIVPRLVSYTRNSSSEEKTGKFRFILDIQWNLFLKEDWTLPPSQEGVVGKRFVNLFLSKSSFTIVIFVCLFVFGTAKNSMYKTSFIVN